MIDRDDINAHDDDGVSLVALSAVFLVAAGLFAYISRGVATKKSRPLDRRARKFVRSHRSKVLDVAVKPVTILSLPPLVASATAALAYWLYREERTPAATAVAIAPVIAATVGQSFTMFMTQRNPPDKGNSRRVTEASYPSGHTTGVMAEALTIAYVLTREQIATPSLLAALVAWPLVVPAARVYRDRHWLTDVLAGLSAGTAVAAATIMLYEIWKSRERIPMIAEPAM